MAVHAWPLHVHGAPPPPLGSQTKGGRRKAAGRRTIAHELHNWKSYGYPKGDSTPARPQTPTRTNPGPNPDPAPTSAPTPPLARTPSPAWSPSGMDYSCNITAYFKPAEADLTIKALRRMLREGQGDLPPSLTVVDDYTVHKLDSFKARVWRASTQRVCSSSPA